MDSDSCIKVLTGFVLIQVVSTDVTIVVTKKECGQTIELEPQSTVHLEYRSADVGDYFQPCVLDFVNNYSDDETCIKSDNQDHFNLHCLMTLKYYPEGYPSKMFQKDYSCFAFKLRPLCDRHARSSVVFRTPIMYKNDTTTVMLYTSKYIPTTTRRWTESSWSSWSSSSSDNDYDDDDDKTTAGLVIGLTAAVIVVAVVLILCVKACSSGSTPPKPQYEPPVVQYCPQTQHGNQFGHQPQYPGSQTYPPSAAGFPHQGQYTSATSQFPGYQVHAPVCQQIPGAPAGIHQEEGQIPQPSAPVITNEPPPPYPGY